MVPCFLCTMYLKYQWWVVGHKPLPMICYLIIDYHSRKIKVEMCRRPQSSFTSFSTILCLKDSHERWSIQNLYHSGVKLTVVGVEQRNLFCYLQQSPTILRSRRRLGLSDKIQCSHTYIIAVTVGYKHVVYALHICFCRQLKYRVIKLHRISNEFELERCFHCSETSHLHSTSKLSTINLSPPAFDAQLDCLYLSLVACMQASFGEKE